MIPYSNVILFGTLRARLIELFLILTVAIGTIPLHESFHKLSLVFMGAKGSVENWGVFHWGFCGYTVTSSQWPWFCVAGGLGVFTTYGVLWWFARKRLPLLGYTLIAIALGQLGYGLWEMASSL